MSAFYDQASLVVVPSGYKSGKIYAQKPLTTDGQLTFTRASTATRVNASGLIETVASGVPRLDYTNSTCPKLLLEPQRSNIALFSEQFDNALYIKSNGTITANSVVSPDGTLSADKFESAAAGVPEIIQSTLNASAKTISVYAKAGNVSNFRIWVGSEVNFDLSNGTVVSGAGTIQNAGNGWYRCIVSNTTFTNFNIYFIASASGQFVYLWGAQLEVGAYATSYIPTTSAAVTRLADSGTTSIPSLINASEGVLFLDYQPLNASDAYPVDFQLQYNGSNSTNGVTIYHDSATPSIAVRSGSSLIFGASLTATTAGTRNKIAIAYKGSDFAVYQNGVLKASQSSGAAPANLNEIRLSDGTRHFSINQALVFKTRLTNAQLAELTTL